MLSGNLHIQRDRLPVACFFSADTTLSITFLTSHGLSDIFCFPDSILDRDRQVGDQRRKPLGFREYDLEEVLCVASCHPGPLEKRFRVTLDAGYRRPQLVRDIRHEIFSYLLQTFERRDVMKHQDRAVDSISMPE